MRRDCADIRQRAVYSRYKTTRLQHTLDYVAMWGSLDLWPMFSQK